MLPPDATKAVRRLVAQYRKKHPIAATPQPAVKPVSYSKAIVYSDLPPANEFVGLTQPQAEELLKRVFAVLGIEKDYPLYLSTAYNTYSSPLADEDKDGYSTSASTAAQGWYDSTATVDMDAKQAEEEARLRSEYLARKKEERLQAKQQRKEERRRLRDEAKARGETVEVSDDDDDDDEEEEEEGDDDEEGGEEDENDFWSVKLKLLGSGYFGDVFHASYGTFQLNREDVPISKFVFKVYKGYQAELFTAYRDFDVTKYDGLDRIVGGQLYYCESPMCVVLPKLGERTAQVEDMTEEVVSKLSADIETIYKPGLVYADVRLENIVFPGAGPRVPSFIDFDNLVLWAHGMHKVMRNRAMYDGKAHLSLREADLQVLKELGAHCAKLKAATAQAPAPQAANADASHQYD